jgi:hypothetical protein
MRSRACRATAAGGREPLAQQALRCSSSLGDQALDFVDRIQPRSARHVDFLDPRRRRRVRLPT